MLFCKNRDPYPLSAMLKIMDPDLHCGKSNVSYVVCARYGTQMGILYSTSKCLDSLLIFKVPFWSFLFLVPIQVARAIFQRYPNPFASHVLSEDTVYRYRYICINNPMPIRVKKFNTVPFAGKLSTELRSTPEDFL